ncbi:hypothetical protein Tco_0633095 [Tanacetum coccineum]
MVVHQNSTKLHGLLQGRRLRKHDNTDISESQEKQSKRARTGFRESEEYKKKPKIQSRSQKSQIQSNIGQPIKDKTLNGPSKP